MESNFITILFICILVVLCVYPEKLPDAFLWQMSTTIGRMLLLLFLYIIYLYFGIVPSIFFAIAVGLLLANRPLKKPTQNENFVSRDENFEQKVIDVPEHGKKWFIERVLPNETNKIVVDRVLTLPVQE